MEDYFNEKYGVEAVVTYKGIAGGIFLGYDPSSVQYYNVTVMITDNDIESKYYVEVHGRVTDGADELYVKSEAYYDQIIKERMEEWLDGYVSKTNIDEYFCLYYASEVNRFPCEYKVTATAEEIIKSVSSIEDNIERPDLTFYLIIPQSEYEKHINIEYEFSVLKTYINEINGKIEVSLNVYSDDDYLSQKADEQSKLEILKQIKIIT